MFRKIVVCLVALVCSMVLCVTQVKAYGISYSFTISCDNHSSDKVRVTQRVELIAPDDARTSVRISDGRVNEVRHFLYVDGWGMYKQNMSAKPDKRYGEEVYLGEFPVRTNLGTGYYLNKWSDYFDYYAEEVKAEFCVVKGNSREDIKTFWVDCE